MWFALSVIAGLAVGGVIAWLLAKERTRKETRNLVTALRTPHIGGIGKGLEKANEAYNSAVGSLEARVLPAARKFKDFGVVPGAEIPVLSPVETTPRALQLPDGNETVEKDE